MAKEYKCGLEVNCKVNIGFIKSHYREITSISDSVVEKRTTNQLNTNLVENFSRISGSFKKLNFLIISFGILKSR